MDRTDIRIINLLQENAKLPAKDIGAAVGLSAPAVAERINRLREADVISGFHAKVNDAKMGNGIAAFVSVNVPPAEYASFCAFCEEEPSVAEHHHIIGLNNALIRVRVPDTEALEELLARIRRFGLSNTSVLLSTYFTQKSFPEKEER